MTYSYKLKMYRASDYSQNHEKSKIKHFFKNSKTRLPHFLPVDWFSVSYDQRCTFKGQQEDLFTIWIMQNVKNWWKMLSGCSIFSSEWTKFGKKCRSIFWNCLFPSVLIKDFLKPPKLFLFDSKSTILT